LYDVLSAGLAFLCCMAFPAAFMLSRLARRPAVGATFVAFVFGVAVSYNMDAAPVAIGLGAIAFAATYLGGPHVLTGTLIAGAALALSWGVLAEAAMARGAGGWLDATFGANWSLRLGYWARIQELIGHAPVAGHGFGAGRVLGRSGEFDGPVPVPFMHPHNGVLEIWLDLGLIGVALVAAWAATGARRVLGTVPDRAVLATIGATIATTSVFVLVSFSIWLGWWLSALGLIAAALVLVNRVAARAEI
jgi:O-antigen ligase